MPWILAIRNVKRVSCSLGWQRNAFHQLVGEGVDTRARIEKRHIHQHLQSASCGIGIACTCLIDDEL